MSLQLLIDRFTRRDPAIKLDATHYGTTQTVLLTLTHVDRLIEELTHARQAMQAANRRRGRTGETR
ncbi:precorrin-4 C11-methyltransferase [Micromonospora sp. CA-248260]|uniref:precorrin-4 C11-methyltransferase n=1 Tax=Micromonospora sp. CA-248260 TaxID=3239962 RepID=UPI003D8B63DF